MSELAQALDRLSSHQRRHLLRRLREASARAVEESPAAPESRIGPRARGVTPPLSFSQERLWFLDRFDPGSAAYNLTSAIEIEGRLAVPSLAGAVERVVRRHEVLRTTFAPAGASDPAVVQVVAPPPPVPLPVVDLCGLPASERAVEAARLTNRQARRPFDLERGPLLRLALLRLSADRHQALVSMHHAVSDGWSFSVFLDEVASFYRGAATGAPAVLPPLPIQYGDFALWQREFLRGERLEEELAWWRERLAGAPQLLELPTDRPRAAVRAHRGAQWRWLLPGEVMRGVRRLSQGLGATPFMALLAALQVLLGRWSGQDDLLLGTPVAGRGRVECEGLIGFFVNTLVLRARLADDPAFSDLLARVRDETRETFSHQDLPFEKLVEELEPERSLSHTPLFQVMLNLDTTPAKTADLPGLRLRARPVESVSAQFDLHLFFVEVPGGLHGTVTYDPDLFEATSVGRLARQLATLLEAAVARPQHRISRLPALGEAERQQLLREWNDTAVGRGGDRCLHELLAEPAAAAPDAVALECGDEQVSYRALHRSARGLARRLHGLGVGPEVVVGLWLGRSPETVIALLAVLESGGAYLPLDPSYPGPRLAAMLDDAEVPLLLAAPRHREPPPPASPRSVLVGAPTPATAAEADDPPRVPVSPDGLAYLIYTSGSTGRPKGVQVSHRALVNVLRSMGRRPGVAAGDRLLAVTTLAFDIAAVEVFLPLLAGGRLVLADRDTASDGLRLARAAARSAATVMQATPATWRSLLEAGWGGAGRLKGISGGEALPDELALRLEGRLGSLWNFYGPTETTVWSSAEAVRPRRGRVTVGRPIDATAIYLADRRGRAVPPGVTGEPWIGGDGVARGYRGRPGQTAERFVPDPFGGRSGGRAYRTGDLARLLHDGRLDHLGRMDHQVKLRGHRIELGEIEAVLAGHPAVLEAAVLLRRDLAAGDALVAYAALRDGSDGAAGELPEFVARLLPAYMVPSVFVPLPRLPRTPNGKIDRRSLPRPRRARQVDPEAPRTPFEEMLAQLFAEVLQSPEVGVGESFFALGGHSLLATRLVSRIRQCLGVEVPVRAVFEHPTASGLARQVERELEAGEAETLPPIEPVDRDGALPLSFAQQRLWFLHQMDPGSAAYNLPAAVRWQGPLAPRVLAEGFAVLVRRHETLRTTFAMGEDGPVQRIGPAGPFPLPAVDLRRLAPGERRTLAGALARREGARPFDLERGPLLRVRLLAIGRDEFVVLFTMHHVVSDAWSMDLTVRELAAVYEALGQGRPSPLAELPLQYADFAAWQRRWLSEESLAGELAFWRERLGDSPPALDLPTDRPRPAVRSSAGARCRVAVPPEEAGAFAAAARRHGVTLFMALLAAFQALLARYTGQSEVTVGTPIAGRHRIETESLIGFFINMLVMRSPLGGDPGFGELLGRVREVALAAYSHPNIPFEQLVDELQPERDPSRTPLFQAVFQLHNAPRGASRLEGVRLSHLEVDAGTAMFDLRLALGESEGGLGGFVEYSADLFDRSTVERMMGHFRTLLAAAVADPERRLSRLPLLSPGERHQLLAEWNDTERRPDRPPALVHQLFEEAAEATPEAVAVVADGHHLSYRRLDARASRLGRLLRELGVAAGELVAFHLERSEEMVVAMLGVLESGGAYVPLDATLPPERARWILAAMGVRVLLADGATLAVAADLLGALPDLAHLVRLDAGEPPEVGEGAGRAWSDADLARRSGERLAPAAGLDDLAYVIFTSGSTGTPKGVMERHRPVVNLIDWVNRACRVEAGERLLFVTSPGFDLSVYDVFGILAAGGTVRVASRREVESPEALVGILLGEGITFWDSAPAALQQLTPVFPAAGAPAPPPLRRVFLSGDWIPLGLPDLVRASFPRARVVALGGATEATVWSNSYPVGRIGRHWKSVPYGRPIWNARYFVLDEGVRPCPVGVSGDLFIAGGCLSSGYAGAPRLTAWKYLPDPYAGAVGAVMYRTGDRARFWADGLIEFLGRLDHQVKVRGFRIELGEIEAVLSQHPGVREAVALVREDRPGDRRLVAYAVAEAPSPPSPEALRDFLDRLLPDYMVPAAILLLDALPVTANGKLDRNALPAPERPEEAAIRPPRTRAEEVLAEIWRQILRLERVSVDANFFELGGDSILSVQVVSRAAREGLRLYTRQVFEHPTIAGLAAVAEVVDEAAPMEGAVAGPGEAIEDVYPVSPTQQGMLFHTLRDPGSGVYVEQIHVRLSGNLDESAFAEAWRRAVERHPVLRTAFDGLELERPLQVVHRRVALSWRREDWRSLPPAEIEGRLEAYLAEDRRRGFDVLHPPLLRLVLFRTGDREHHFVWSCHGALLDGWSVANLWGDLLGSYEAYRLGQEETAVLSRPPFRDFIAWLGGQETAASESYWRGALVGFTRPTALGVDRPAEAESEGGVEPALGGSLSARLPVDVSAALRALAGRHRVTLNALVLGAWGLLLSRHGGGGDILFGEVRSGRSAPLPHVEDMVGMFLNSLPVRVAAADQQPLGEWVAGLQRDESERSGYEHTPLVQIRGWSELPAGESLFQSLVIVEDEPLGGAAARAGEADLRVTAVQVLRQNNYPLTLVATPGDRLVLRLLFDAHRFDRTTIRRLLGHVGGLLDGMTALSGRPIGALQLLSPAERHQLVAEWSRRSPDAVVQRAAAAGAESVSVTHPPANTSLHVLDRAQRRVPVGVPGELHVGGGGLSREYLEGPARTAERFVPCSLGDRPGARLYRTGVVGRRRPDGSIETLGRVNDRGGGQGSRAGTPVSGDGAARREYTAPRTPFEELLAGVWSEVLGVERVGLDDEFLSLGGHSLSAVRVVALLDQTLGLRPPLTALFETPTLGEFVQRIESGLAAADRARLEALFAEVGEVEDGEARALLSASEPPPEGVQHG